MTPQNLATCIGPNILIPKEEDLASIIHDSPIVNQVKNKETHTNTHTHTHTHTNNQSHTINHTQYKQ